MEPETPQVVLPTIHVGWNPETQDVMLKFDPKEFKTFTFMIAVLDMAKAKAEKMQQVAMVNGMNEAARAEQLRRQLRLG